MAIAVIFDLFEEGVLRQRLLMVVGTMSGRKNNAVSFSNQQIARHSDLYSNYRGSIRSWRLLLCPKHFLFPIFALSPITFASFFVATFVDRAFLVFAFLPIAFIFAFFAVAFPVVDFFQGDAVVIPDSCVFSGF
jgi:hypothetical protein